MLPMPIALPTPQLVELAGADAVNFAQAQFSSDVHALQSGHWQWSAWLSPQGRVRAFFHLLRDSDEALRLLLRGGDAAALCAALRPYVLRAKVALRAADDAQALGHDDAPAPGLAQFGLVNDAEGTALALPGATPRRLLL